MKAVYNNSKCGFSIKYDSEAYRGITLDLEGTFSGDPQWRANVEDLLQLSEISKIAQKEIRKFKYKSFPNWKSVNKKVYGEDVPGDKVFEFADGDNSWTFFCDTRDNSLRAFKGKRIKPIESYQNYVYIGDKNMYQLPRHKETLAEVLGQLILTSRSDKKNPWEGWEREKWSARGAAVAEKTGIV